MRSLLLTSLLVSGCAAIPSKNASSIRISDAKSVASCEFVTTIDARAADWDFLAPSVGPENAKTEVLEKAAAANATNVVWLTLAGANVAANAYRCHATTAAR